MIKNIVWILKTVRTELLEKFIIPDLNISYWDFCIYLLIVGVVATVLINSVSVAGGKAASVGKQKDLKEKRSRNERKQKVLKEKRSKN